jgi:transposase InsO family protein
MKEWMTARDIASNSLPDMPSTESATIRFADRNAWNSHPTYARKRVGRGGGFEYHYRILPTLAQVAYVQRHMSVGETIPSVSEDGPVVSGAAGKERDARLAVLAAFETFSRGLRNLKRQAHIQVFCDKYQMGAISVEPWVKEIIPSVGRRTLWRWLSVKKAGKTEAFAVDRSKARAGTGVLDNANGGQVALAIVGYIAHAPQLSADDVRDMVRFDFGDLLMVHSKTGEKQVPVPSERTFQAYIARIKEEKKVELLKLTNPDKFRSHMQPSGRGMLSDITAPNQMWQIDASPVDALCTDGRHSVYVCVDIATRRFITYMSKTPRASAVGLLLRKAILAWGVPKIIKTDNGSDFTAGETKRLFTNLNIEPDVSEAYSPAQKGHVERAIKTWQHGFVTLLPGYVGHNVTERKAIEDRKSFADRLGQDTADAFSVQYTAAQFQERSDRWCLDKYQHEEHEGLGKRTPFAVAMASVTSIRMVQERALDVLLMPVVGKNGIRTITKFGIRHDHNYYRSGALDAGADVFVRQDPNDAGKVHVFTPDQSQYLGEAICPELAGIHPQTFERARKELNQQLLKERVDPIKRQIKKIVSGPALIDKSLEIAARDIPNVVPLRKPEEIAHETPQILAALDVTRQPAAAEMPRELTELHAQILADLAPQAPGGNVTPIRTAATAEQKFRRWLDFKTRAEAGEEVSMEEAHWAGHFETSAEFKAQKALWDDFGDQAPGLRT